ncbi:SRPBCC family protein [Thermopolyspora sp. NPDC052614]|uniref:SRPBCC family protein n=1 Tax=Thermopolyspora sp. NPDC052614 TaxID=3155682 RepID=UPI00342EB340
MDDAGKVAEQGRQATEGTPAEGILKELPVDRLTGALQDLAVATAERALTTVTGKVEGLTGRLGDYAGGGGSSLVKAVTGSGDSVVKATVAGAAKGGIKGGLKGGLKGAIKGLFGKFGKGGDGSSGKKLKVTNIVETVDVGAPRRVVYNQWTQFQQFPTFMKKVENVNQESDEKLAWKAQVFWSHRTWRSTILRQVPDERIIWRSEGDKGHVDGSVSFHALTPELTRVMLVLEYHPQGFFERTGNLWRAQGRRARLEFKHFARHVMTQVMVNPDEVAKDGWRGEIRDGKVVADHEKGLAEERAGEGPEEREEPAEGGEEEPARARKQAPEEAGESEQEEQEEEKAPAGEKARDQADRPTSEDEGERRTAEEAEEEPYRPVRRTATKGGK